jgi:filamentous hemagglutinin family protein
MINTLKSQLTFFPVTIITLCLSSFSSYSQIIPDNSLGSQATERGNIIQIDGGITSENGVNLFHSFQEFSIPIDRIAYFNNDAAIVNIFTRITGNSISNIEGIIKANGSANLFLINPNGIIFGNNARLDLGGSFVATTAEKIVFIDGTEFNTKDTSTEPLLTITIPIGLGFGNNTGNITSSASVLRVDKGKTLALIGGELNIGELNSDRLFDLSAKNASIELISVDNDSYVDIQDTTMGWTFNSLDTDNWQNINLDNAKIRANNVKIQGQTIVLSGKSTIVSRALINDSSTVGLSIYGNKLFIQDSSSVNLYGSGKITIDTSDSIELTANQINVGIFANALNSESNAGDIDIVTRKLVVKNGAAISTSILSGSSNAGNIHIRASESVELIGTFLDPENPDPLDEISSGLFVNAIALEAGLELTGNAGNLILETATLVIKNGAHIESVTTGQGNGGVIEINATDSILLSNTSPTSGYDLRSGIFASSSNRNIRTTGNVGQININTKNLVVEKLATVSANNFELGEGGEINVNVDHLILRDGGYIEAGTFDDGNGGTLNVNAKSSIEISGIGTTFVNIDGIIYLLLSESRLSTRSGLILNALNGDTIDLVEGKGIAGNLTISTPQLTIKDGAQVNISAIVEGGAGNLFINGQNILLDNESKITAESDKGNLGNITLNVDRLTLLGNSSITTNTDRSSQGGNINIDTNALTLLENSSISADAKLGKGGTINIITQGLFSSDNNNITAIGKNPEFDGIVEINSPDVNSTQGVLNISPQIIDATTQISKACDRNLNDETASSFTIIGRGGIPNSPIEPQTENTTFASWISLPNDTTPEANITEKNRLTYSNKTSNRIIEARELVVDKTGKIILATTENLPHEYNPELANSCDLNYKN